MIENFPKSVQGNRYKGIGSRDGTKRDKNKQIYHQDILQLKWEKLKIENSKGSKKKRVIYKGIPIRNQNLWKPE